MVRFAGTRAARLGTQNLTATPEEKVDEAMMSKSTGERITTERLEFWALQFAGTNLKRDLKKKEIDSNLIVTFFCLKESGGANPYNDGYIVPIYIPL